MTVTGFNPHKVQAELLQSIVGGKEKYHIASIGRQFGKSMMGMNLALYWGFNNSPCKILWVSPVYSQANKVQKELMSAIAASGIVKSNNYSSSELELKNGSVIYFRSAERYDNIRGMTLDYAIIDEAAFIKDDAWSEAIKPTLLVRGKKVLFISTPKGKNWFYELFQYGQSDDYPNYKSYKGSSYDTPFISMEEIDDAKRTVPELILKQEYLAEFIDGGGEVFANIDQCTFPAYPKPQGKVFAGLDIGKQEDYTVLTLMDSKGRVVDIYRDNKNQWSVMIAEVVKRVRQFNASLMVEVNGVGDPIFEQIKSQYANTHPFVTTFSPLYSELSYFTYEYSPKTRSIRYGHPTGLHDDTVISLSLCNYNRKKNKTYGTYAVR